MRMQMDGVPRRPPAERQLALPLEPVVGPPSLAGLGPAVPPRTVWRGLTPPARAGVRATALRVLREVLDDA
jgi:hypothetical protein